MFIYLRDESQKEKIVAFLKENGIGYQEDDVYYKRRNFEEKRQKLENDLNYIYTKYIPDFKKHSITEPGHIELIINPEKHTVIVYNTNGVKIDLREHGHTQCLKAMWMDKIKRFVKEIKEDGICSKKTSFYLKTVEENKTVNVS